MKIKLSPLAICLAFGLTAVAGSAQANWWTAYLKNKNKNPPVAEASPGNSNLPSARYPNGLGWRAIENDFIQVDADHVTIMGKIDAVKVDTEDLLDGQGDILDGQGDILDGQGDILDGQGDILDGQGDLSDQIEDLAGAVEAQGNVLEVQVRVGAISTDELLIDSSTVTLYVQVNKNGVGLDTLGEGNFTYDNGAPFEGAGICAGCVTNLDNGLYMIELDTLAGVSGDFAGTLAVADEGDNVSIDVDSDDSNGASIVTFEIEGPIEPDPA